MSDMVLKIPYMVNPKEPSELIISIEIDGTYDKPENSKRYGILKDKYLASEVDDLFFNFGFFWLKVLGLYLLVYFLFDYSLMYFTVVLIYY
jgi:hypothetical protein